MEPLDTGGPLPSPAHDALVLDEARRAGARIRARRRRPWLAAGLAAAAGLAVGLAAPALRPAPTPPALTIPAGRLTRGAGAEGALPVERAPAELWYRHIQALLEAGEVAEAEAHLRRFVQLHPDYRPAP